MKKRIAVTISFSFSIRYIVRTGLLEKMKTFCEPVVCIFWNQEDLIKELLHKGFEVHVIPESGKGAQYITVRYKLDYWFRYFRLKSFSKNFEPRYVEKFKSRKKVLKGRLREYYHLLKFFIPGYTQKLLRVENELLQSDTNYAAMVDLIVKLRIDALFCVTPFHHQEDIFLRAAKACNLKMMTSILSFDNIVKRGWVPVDYDCYMVWNKYNAAEIRRIYVDAVKQNNDNVQVVGAAQFDFYKRPEYVLPKKDWLQLVGLPDTNRKIILYAGGPVSLFPQEPQFLQHIIDALEKGEIASEPIILFRCHPIDKVERWKDAVTPSAHLYFDTSWTGNTKLTYANVTDVDIMKLCSTLNYTDVHVNVASTMTIDGSAYYKPQICPAYDEVYKNEKYPISGFYYQEHYSYTTKTKGIALANSKKELIDFINDALQNPSKYITRCDDVLKEVITYTDGHCTERVAAVIENEIAKI